MGKKIWIMNHYATSMFRDKAGRHYWFAKKLEERGYAAVVFCASTYLNNNESVDLNGKQYSVQHDGKTPFVFVKTPAYSGNGVGRVKNMAGFYFGLFKAADAYARQDGRPDVILASSVHPLTMAAGIKIAKKIGIPCICEVRDLWPEAIFAFGKAKEDSLLGKALIRGEHWIYRNADALIFTKEGSCSRSGYSRTISGVASAAGSPSAAGTASAAAASVPAGAAAGAAHPARSDSIIARVSRTASSFFIGNSS